jgi:DNA gyrase/topoisomerase IV subunit B
MADQYKKHTHREHILELPDTYVGSTETHEEVRWVFDSATGKMAHRKVAFNPGFYKIFDEILVNARDALVRTQQDPKKQPIKHIEISVTKEGDKVVGLKKKENLFSIKTENGKELINILIHLLDPSQNDKFQDKYFANIPIDFSKVLFINQ